MLTSEEIEHGKNHEFPVYNETIPAKHNSSVSVVDTGERVNNATIEGSKEKRTEKPQPRGWKKKCELDEFKYAPHCFRFRTRRSAAHPGILPTKINEKLLQEPSYHWVPEIVRGMAVDGLYKENGQTYNFLHKLP
ncbi:Oidioi.mRNA.OKI2018_I69.PAR.g12959.t1.cds [Oikopleura dioica]|uniref:Oidioi.mRNA.OKI2018_I69.PAR.g12959.t1.cds n=1 Tax=Oikopleura dioica TaxID=34765 RepID=A0ABN7S7Z3_OIKDI|nr:Oidioi.mRNA.OKI2018_I69.PAR.g12959.t1.cds [Oikopleura dioica]